MTGGDAQECFLSIDQWREWAQNNFANFRSDRSKEIVNYGLSHGIESAFFGRIEPSEIQILGDNYRESYLAKGLNSRQRAILELLAEHPGILGNPWAKIYAAEALTPFALTMRGRFPLFVGSEYTDTEEGRKKIFPVPVEDLHQLSFPSGVFDAVMTNDVLEHVPFLDQALREMARVLRTGGVMLATFPFTWNTYQGIVKARIVAGKIEYLTEPEYHGNPVDPEGGSLVFTIPGWDVVDLCLACGFRRAEMVFLSSARCGITAFDIAGINVLRAYA